MFVCCSLEELSDSGEVSFGEFLSFIDSQRFTLMFEVALEGMKRSDVPKSDGRRPVRLPACVLLPLPRLLCELSFLVSEKVNLLEGILEGLEVNGESTCVRGLTMGVGRKIDRSLSRVISGGGTSLDVDIGQDADSIARGGTVEGAAVDICSGRDNLFAY